MKCAFLVCLGACVLALGSFGCSTKTELRDRDAGSAGAGRGEDAGPPGSSGASGQAAGATAGRSGTGGASGMPAPGALNVDELFAASCRLDVVPQQLLPANILFVLDRSASMGCNPPPTTDSATCEASGERASSDVPTKWEITQRAIVESLNILPEDSWVGLGYFSNDDSCGVQAEPLVPMRKNSPVQKNLFTESLKRSEPGGATPLVGATILAYQYLYGLAREGSILGNNFVVLLTDGKQSGECGDPNRCSSAEECTELLIRQEVPKAAGEGVWIRTFVIGVPGSEADGRTLSLIAEAGRTARPGCDMERDCHFDVSAGGDFSASLRQALQNIVGQTRSCDLPAPRDAEVQDKINLIYTPSGGRRELVLNDERPCEGGANGWQYAEDYTRIRLCGQACSKLRADPEAQLQILYGCPIQGPQ